MKRILRCCRVIPVAVSLLWLAQPLRANAQAASPHAASWAHVIVEEPMSSQGTCRYIDITTRGYNLQGTPNGGVAGGYFEQTERGWFIGATDGCPSGQGPDPSAPHRFFRNDLWMVSGESVTPDTVKILARHAKCLGSCGGQPSLPERFETSLTTRGGTLEDLQQKGKLSPFRSGTEVTRAAQSAAAAFFDLMRPLLTQNCNAFYVSSLDPAQRLAVPQDQFCAVAGQISQFLGPALYDEPMFAFSASVGSLRATGPLLFGQGDVIVQRAVVLSGGGKVVMRAILRSQPDARWKILRLLP